jgi:hypothetical protein
LIPGEGRAPAAAHVAEVFGFEFIDFGAGIGEEQGAIRPGQGVREIEDFEAGEGLGQ